MKEKYFNVIARIIKDPIAVGHPVEVRACCFRILTSLLYNPSTTAYKQLLFKSEITSTLVAGKLAAEDSEEVLRAIL